MWKICYLKNNIIEITEISEEDNRFYDLINIFKKMNFYKKFWKCRKNEMNLWNNKKSLFN